MPSIHTSRSCLQSKHPFEMELVDKLVHLEAILVVRVCVLLQFDIGDGHVYFSQIRARTHELDVLRRHGPREAKVRDGVLHPRHYGKELEDP